MGIKSNGNMEKKWKQYQKKQKHIHDGKKTIDVLSNTY